MFVLVLIKFINSIMSNRYIHSIETNRFPPFPFSDSSCLQLNPVKTRINIEHIGKRLLIKYEAYWFRYQIVC